MKFDWKLWAIVILTGVIILLILFQPKRQPNLDKIKALEYGIAHADVKIAQLTKDSTKLADKIQADSIKQVAERSTFRNSIGSLQARLRDKRVKIDTLILESPTLRDYVATADSVIQIQGTRIDTLESNLKELRVDMAGLTFTFEEMLQLEREKFIAQETLTKEYKKQARKSKRANRFLKAGAVVLGVGGFLLGSQL